MKALYQTDRRLDEALAGFEAARARLARAEPVDARPCFERALALDGPSFLVVA